MCTVQVSQIKGVVLKNLTFSNSYKIAVAEGFCYVSIIMIAFKNVIISLLKHILPKILSSAIIYMILLLKPLKKDIKLLTTYIK